MDTDRSRFVFGGVVIGVLLGLVSAGWYFSDTRAQALKMDERRRQAKLDELQRKERDRAAKIEDFEVRGMLSRQTDKFDSVRKGMLFEETVARLGDDYHPLPTGVRLPRFSWRFRDPLLPHEAVFEVEFERNKTVRSTRCYWVK